MAGVKGAGGPVPKRSTQRRRTNKPAAGDPVKATGSAPFEPPKSNSKWHPVAKRWFDALAPSGQSQFYEPSDWATAYLLAEAMSRDLRPIPLVTGKDPETGDDIIEKVPMPIKGAALAAWLKGAAALMVTEGDRRRLAIELQRASPETGQGAANVAHIADARARLHGAN